MPVQHQLFPDPPAPEGSSAQPTGDPAAPRPTATGPTATGTAPDLAPIWLQRTSLFILVVFCIYLGVIVTILPWWTDVWDHNLFLTSHPQLWSWLRLRATRGVISGMGLLDIWIGISEAIHYHEQRR